MSRTPDEAHRLDLLDRAVDFVCRHGLSGLSLRPLAKALGSSPRVLLYYFGSKERLLIEIIERGRARQRATMSNLKLSSGLSAPEISRLLWQQYSAPQWLPLMRLFFEVYALALQDRDRFPGFLDGAIEDWLRALEPCATLPGYTRERARAYATLLIAVFRGFMLDLCATGDRARVDRAVDLWLSMIESPPSEKEPLNAAG